MTICPHIPLLHLCRCGLKYYACPICEPRFTRCQSCQDEQEAIGYKLETQSFISGLANAGHGRKYLKRVMAKKYLMRYNARRKGE